MSLIYIHLNRLITKYDLNMIFLAGPGHGAPAILSNTYLEGTYSEIYPDKSEDREGLKKFFTQFSFPYDTPILGYKVNTANILRLWKAEAPESSDYREDLCLHQSPALTGSTGKVVNRPFRQPAAEASGDHLRN